MKEYDVMGIAGFLPLDLNFLLASKQSKAGAAKEAKTADLHAAISGRVPFDVVSFHRSGGGKIANMACFLGMAGDKVAICGRVGSDRAGECIKQDLLAHGVNIKHVLSADSASSKVLFLLRSLRNQKVAESLQIASANRPNVRFASSVLNGIAPSRVILLARANQSVLKFVQMARKHGSKIVFHLSSIPWRDPEDEPVKEEGQKQSIDQQRALLKDILKQVDLLVVRIDLRDELFKLLNASKGNIQSICNNIPAELIVFYGGVNLVQAIHRNCQRYIEPTKCVPFEIGDKTGMFDCFHGALLSFWLRTGLKQISPWFARNALGFANEVASRSAVGIGARSFPSTIELRRLRTKYLKKHHFQFDVALSFARDDRSIANDLAERLRQENCRVFFDDFHTDKLAGEFLNELLPLVFRDLSRFSVPLISRHYLKRHWPRMEFEAMKARANLQEDAYIIPIYLDATKLRDFPKDIGYLSISPSDNRALSMEDIVRYILKKLRRLP